VLKSVLRGVTLLFLLGAGNSLASAEPAAPAPSPGTAPPAVARPPVPEGCTAPAESKGRRGPPPYPSLAKVMGWEGSTDLQFTVEADGRVRPHGITIVRSSGFAELDGAALTYVLEHRFAPGNCLGVARAMEHVHRISFRLEEWSPHCVRPRLADGEPTRAPWPIDVRGASEDVWVDVAFAVDAQGRVNPAHMAILTPSGNRRLDFAALEYINARRFEPMRCEGTASNAQMGYRVKFETGR
jgi:TonB family protein